MHPNLVLITVDQLIAELSVREEGYTDGSSLIPGRTPVCLLDKS
ncbi:hypothetical protein [Muricomes intestini]|jgi:hypothetical protein